MGGQMKALGNGNAKTVITGLYKAVFLRFKNLKKYLNFSKMLLSTSLP